MMRRITENTLVPVSLVLVLLGGAFWLASMNSTASETSQKVEVLTEQQDEYYKEIQKVDERLSRIEGRLGIDH